MLVVLIEDLNNGFFATFFVRPPAHRKKVAAAGSATATALSIFVQFRYILLYVKPFLYALHIVLACDDCPMGVNLCETGAFISVNPFFK